MIDRLIKKDVIFLMLFLSLFTGKMYADNPVTVSTFNCISLYWSPAGGAAGKDVLVQFRKSGSAEWNDGLSMKYNPIDNTDNDLADYRGSIVELEPNTTYEIKLTLEGAGTSETITAKTWTENFPISKTITVPSQNAKLTITESGSESGYVLIDGTGSTIDVDNNDDYCIDVKANYVIIRGFTLKDARKCGIRLSNNHDVIIEKCDISGWGEADGSGFGASYQSAIYSTEGSSETSTLKRIVVQRCKIHDPRYDSNSWAEEHNGTYHPNGPQAISFYNSAGNHVIRYNEIWSDYDHMYNDVLGFGTNASYVGYPAFDSDIYGNYISHCWDDAIEAEGADRNVRIWGNYIDNFYIAIGNAAVSIGPLYVWKNFSGRSYSPEGSAHGTYSGFMKMGYSKNDGWMTGYIYVFNNTILQTNGEGAGGLGTREDSNREIRHCISRNNIFHVRQGTENSISNDNDNLDNDFDYDLCNRGYPDGSEKNGITGTPEYISGAEFNHDKMTANFFIVSGSNGYDAGIVIPNFADTYYGNAPDMGALESGGSVAVFGVNAYMTGGEYTLTVDTIGYGTVSPKSGTYSYGTDVEITASPLETYEFKGWRGDYYGAANPLTITISHDVSLTALFASPDSVNYYEECDAAIGHGACESTNAGYYGGGYINFNDDSGAYAEWTNVTAVKDGAYFCTLRYANGTAGVLPGDIYVNGEKVDVLDGSATTGWSDWTVETYIFNLKSGDNVVKIIAVTDGGLPNIDRLTVSAEPTSTKEFNLMIGVEGEGTVLIEPEKDIYTPGDKVKLTANAALGSLFDSWGGDVAGSDNPLTISMDSDINVTAKFISDPDMIVLDGAKAILSEGGKIKTKHAGYNGEGYADTKNELGAYAEWTFDAAEAGTYKCILRYALGGSLPPYRPGDVTVNGSLTGSYALYSTGDFGIWGTESRLLDLVAGENVLRITSTTERGLPNVDILQIDLTSKDKAFNILTTDFTGEGYLSFYPAGAVYEPGQEVAIKAKPHTDYEFDSWSGDLTGNNDSLKFTMNADKSITANFVVATGIEDNFNSDHSFSVRPNPFASSTRFTFNISEPGNVKIVIYDVTGSELAVLTDSYYTTGEYSVVWNVKDLAGSALIPGLYLAKISTGDVVKVIKLLHVR